MAKNKTTFTPGPGDDDYVSEPLDKQQQRWADALADVEKNYPQQSLSKFRGSGGKLQQFVRSYAAFYLDAEGHEFCHSCANQENTSGPPIIAGQLNGNQPVLDEKRMCNGCGTMIYALHVVRQNQNARYLYSFERGKVDMVIAIAFETPVAVHWPCSFPDQYSVTDIPWGKSLSKQLSRFGHTMGQERAERIELVQDRKYFYMPSVTVPQEELDTHLKDLTGLARMAETRPAYVRYEQGIKRRFDSSYWIGKYDYLRRQLAELETYRYVTTLEG